MYDAATAGDRSTPSRLALTAARSGFDGLVVSAERPFDPGLERVREFVGIDVVGARVLDGTEPGLRGSVGRLRPDTSVLIVRGGSATGNRLAVETPAVDVLAAPMRRGGDFNHVLAAAAAENDVAVAIDLGPVLRRSGGARVRHIGALRKLVDLLDDADTPHVVTAGASSHLELRGPRELMALGKTIGIGAAFVRDGLERWTTIVAGNRRRRADDWIAPGVRVESDDEEGEES